MRQAPGRRRSRGDHALVGRADELRWFEQALDELDRGASGGAVVVHGEPGIGKTRLLGELSAHADRRRHLVLAGSGSELEHDLPFSVFVDALDEYVTSLDHAQLATLGSDVGAELADVLPSMSALAPGRGVASQQERYRSHRAVCRLLELLAAATPLVLVLDDFHWADPASVELLSALLLRPPAAAVLTAVALRPHQLPERLSAAFERANRAGALTHIRLDALTLDEASELLRGRADPVEATFLYEESGGNPFYLEQLARSLDRPRPRPTSDLSPKDIGVPVAVAASLGEELALVSADGRRVLEGAAVAGDPFEPELAAAAAAASEAATMAGIDELLQLDLIRDTDVPCRFRFRHPLVRRAVYQASAAGWRLGAHKRCAEVLSARGASAPARAYHVQRSAQHGDTAAVAVLCEAGDAAFRLAPESAARWYADALRLLPDAAPTEDRVELLLAQAKALSAAGRFGDSHQATLEAAAIVPDRPRLRTAVTTACAGVERFIGQYEHAHTRLVRSLDALPERPSVESAELLVELTLNEFYRSRYDAMHDWAARSLVAARTVDDPALVAAALVMRAFASALTGPTDTAQSRRVEAAGLVDRLADAQLAARSDVAGWLAITEVYLDCYADAETHARRALELAHTFGRGDPLHRLYPVLPRILYVRGKLTEAAELLDSAIEAERLLGSPPALAGNLFNRSSVALATGDLDLARQSGEEAVALTRALDDGFVSAWAAVRLAAVLVEAEQPDVAAELLRTRAGGTELSLIPAGWKAYGLELVTRCSLALDRRSDADQAARLARQTATAVGLPLARAWADRAAAAIALHQGRSDRAIQHALASADAAGRVGAPIEEALSRVLAGRAFAADGERERAVAELQQAAATLDACGALRFRDSAERELGKLGCRPHRRTRPGVLDEAGIASLTERELQVARLVVDRRTNPQIAAELYLSKKTVEGHLRTIFRKMDVRSRVELARAVEHADGALVAPTD
jgi:ATP/maltotriose-dependent transcriptional regulator MalT